MIHQRGVATLRSPGPMRRAGGAVPIEEAPVPVADAPRWSGVDDRATSRAADIFDRLFGLLKRQMLGMTLEWRDEPALAADRTALNELNARISEFASALDHIHAALGPDIARMAQNERELRLTRQAGSISRARTGSERTRLPVAAKSALHTAGKAGGSAGSPRPVGS